GTCRRGGSDSPYGAAPAARRGVIEPYRDGARARPLREEPFAAPGWTLAGEPRLTVGGTELVAQALIATTGTPAAGVETTSAPPSPPAEHRALRRSRPALSSGRSRSWRDAAERANDRRRAQNVSI